MVSPQGFPRIPDRAAWSGKEKAGPVMRTYWLANQIQGFTIPDR